MLLIPMNIAPQPAVAPSPLAGEGWGGGYSVAAFGCK
jgi:hypothetical protein